MSKLNVGDQIDTDRMRDAQQVLNDMVNEMHAVKEERRVAEEELKAFRAQIKEEKEAQLRRRTELEAEEKKVAQERKRLEEDKESFGAFRVDANVIEAITVEEAKRRFESIEHDVAVVRKQKLQDLQAEEEALRAKAKAESDALLKESEAMLADARSEQEKVLAEAEAIASEKEAFENAKKVWEETKRTEAEKVEAGRRTLAELKALQHEIDVRRSELELRAEEVARKEKKVDAALLDMESGFSARRNALETELLETKQKGMAQAEASVSAHRASLLKEIDDECTLRREEISRDKEEAQRLIREAKAEFDAGMKEKQAEFELNLHEKTSAFEKERESLRSEIARARKDLDTQQGALEAQKRALDALRSELEEEKTQLQEKRERDARRLRDREENLSAEAEELAEEVKVTWLEEKGRLQSELNRLRSQLKTQDALFSNYEELERRLGGRAAEMVIRDLDLKTEEIRRLKEELSKPSEEIQSRIRELQNKLQEKDALLKEQQKELDANSCSMDESRKLRRDLENMRSAKETAEIKANGLKESLAFYEKQIEEWKSKYEALHGSPVDEATRRQQVETPYLSMDKVAEVDPDYKPDEMEWLKGIHQKCEEYGLHFNFRLLMAFHTALKTAEWAPLSVLAGVSGTGKSELPRLYAHFGGLNFCPVAVQPNWDCQESLLGYFNTIENHFDATPLLNFLAQTQKPAQGDYPDLLNAMNLVLLDEMNLAHPELYFADFLSKLELRRGTTRNDVPGIQVKLGSGITPYKLPLRRNVLWVGTMNQDETTKSLSDKVLDRSIIINFPRPTELKRRPKLNPLKLDSRGQALPLETWRRWLRRYESAFAEDEIRPYKEFIESMNRSLGAVGRAIGHRVWQSIEYYMSNHPQLVDGKENPAERERVMHLAFEDQLVQKVMPKIRGVETRGRAKTECLDKIRNLLVTGVGGNSFNLTEDFDLSCELGYGQFIWQTANYLQKDDETGKEG